MPRERPAVVSPETYLYLVAEVERLRDEVYRLTVDRDHWYMRANYTREQVDEFYRRASMGIDENGEWQWPPR